MVQKQVLSNLISKYYLNGEIKSSKWKCSDGCINAKFINNSRIVFGEISTKNINFPPSEIIIWNTEKILKILNILDNELLIDIKRDKINLQDTNYNVTYQVGTDHQTIPPTNFTNKPNVNFTITQEFITRFIKSKDALNGIELFTVETDKGFNGNELVFKIGDQVDEIEFRAKINEDDHLPKPSSRTHGIPFNANILKEILKCNKTCLSGEFSIYYKSDKYGNEKCIIVLEFEEDQIKSKYYLIRNQ